MAVDRKADHVGNHGGRYTDIDGMTKQFTYVDHDRHTTRLKHWKHKEYGGEPDPSPEEILVRDILNSGVAADKFFIEAFDGTLASKYHFERHRKGNAINGLQLANKYHQGWYQDLEALFKEALSKRLSYNNAQLEEYLNKNYGLQKPTDSENS